MKLTWVSWATPSSTVACSSCGPSWVEELEREAAHRRWLREKKEIVDADSAVITLLSIEVDDG